MILICLILSLIWVDFDVAWVLIAVLLGITLLGFGLLVWIMTWFFCVF